MRLECARLRPIDHAALVTLVWVSVGAVVALPMPGFWLRQHGYPDTGNCLDQKELIKRGKHLGNTMGFAALTGQALQAWLALGAAAVGAAASVVVLSRLEHRRPGDHERSRCSVELLRSVSNGLARVLLVAAIIAVLVALPSAIMNLVVALALAFGVTEGSAWMGTRLNARRAAHRATGEEQPSPGTARL